LIDQNQIFRNSLSNDKDKRWEAAKLLSIHFSSIPFKYDAWYYLVKLTQDKDANVRLAAASGLGSSLDLLPQKEQVMLDLHMLAQYNDPYVRRGVASALGSAIQYATVKDQVWSDLINFARDDDAYVRRGAASALNAALSLMPNKDRIWSDFIILAQSSDAYIRRSAVSALEVLYSQLEDKNKISKSLIDLMTFEDDHIRRRAASTLSKAFHLLPDKNQAWRSLVILAHHEKPQVRKHAISVISQRFLLVSDKEMVWADLLKLLESKDEYIRSKAASTLDSDERGGVASTISRLYLENYNLAGQKERLTLELENEKIRRMRAERDLIWKDISFSAAHKIGNPIFSIETDITSLIKRIKKNRINEALEVIDNILSSIEKAKIIIEQFKSLARAQEIKKAPIPLLPIIQLACNLSESKGISCEIDCPSDIIIYADQEKLNDCFDEFIANAIKWFDKKKKSIKIDVTFSTTMMLNNEIYPKDKCIRICFEDNGCGIPVSNKERIFDVFFTTSKQGVGLGLAIIRRIIEGHGGLIRETGIQGKGAKFEIYIPNFKNNSLNEEGD
jgi:signal transduction histidine kinase